MPSKRGRMGGLTKSVVDSVGDIANGVSDGASHLADGLSSGVGNIANSVSDSIGDATNGTAEVKAGDLAGVEGGSSDGHGGGGEGEDTVTHLVERCLKLLFER